MRKKEPMLAHKKVEEGYLDKALQVCNVVRRWMEDHYGKGVSLAGHCIEASELLVDLLHILDYNVETLPVYVTYDEDNYGQTGYDEHMLVKLIALDISFYIDVTADQFNYGMFPEHHYAPITMSVNNLPYGMSVDTPVYEEEECK